MDKEIWYTYSMEYYSAIKTNEIILFVGKWMEMKIIMLSEISHAQNANYCMLLLICRT
jgi:hypothetical protein